MSVNTCVSCGNIVPEEDRMVCKKCEQKEIKLGKILQTMNATEEEVKEAYAWLDANRKESLL